MREIVGYPGYYATVHGDIYSSKKGRLRLLSKDTSHKGYFRVDLYTPDGKKKKESVHRLIALTFIKNPNNLPEVNHKNGDKKNNTRSNLEWVTMSGNQKHAFASGLNSQIGEKNRTAKLTEKDVLLIRSSGQSNAFLARKFSVTPGAIYNVRSKLTWKHI